MDAAFASPVNRKPLPIWTDDELAAERPRLGEFVPALTPLLLEGPRPRGIVVVFPGGGYWGRAAHEHLPIAECFNRRGFHGAVLDYRTCDRSPRPLGDGPLKDARRAIQLIRRHADAWRVRPDKIAILGFSAGGHLAATASTRFVLGRPDAVHPADHVSSRPDAAVLCYPVISAESFGHAGSIKNLCGDQPTPEQIALWSNEKHVTSQTPPVFLWHTADDPGVPVENSLAMAVALSKAKVPFALHVFPKGRHGLGLAESDPVVGAWPDLCASWLRSMEW